MRVDWRPNRHNLPVEQETDLRSFPVYIRVRQQYESFISLKIGNAAEILSKS